MNLYADINDQLKEISIENCWFLGNMAAKRGTIYVYNQNITIKTSVFSNNFAYAGGEIFCNNDGILTKINNFFLISIKKERNTMKIQIIREELSRNRRRGDKME